MHSMQEKKCQISWKHERRSWVHFSGNESPRAASSHFKAPLLNRLPDAYLLHWLHDAKNEDQFKNIKYFFQHNVIKKGSLDIASEAVKGAIPEWPGKSLDM